MVARRPMVGIGLKEAKTFLWLLVDGLAAWELPELTHVLMEPLDPTRLYEPPENYTRYDKRRFSIPLERLQTIYPSLDLNRARDENDAYQPFYTLDTDNNLWLTSQPPLQATGLVFDKAYGVYL